MQIKLSDKNVADRGHREVKIDQWLSANPKLVTIQGDLRMDHDQTRREESLPVAMGYGPKSSL